MKVEEFKSPFDSKCLQKVDQASYPFRNNKARKNRRRANYWSRIMWRWAGKALHLPCAKLGKCPQDMLAFPND